MQYPFKIFTFTRQEDTEPINATDVEVKIEPLRGKWNNEVKFCSVCTDFMVSNDKSILKIL